ncbi:long-chain fatty acid--CoA ligase (plasmid) [Rhodococcus ruber]|uniref:AMP-dependent synthetase/ligase n=1 Tax=Rhodococcus ruber TaxID=1830 RepID=UPI0026587CAC|nr:long-chain fatty acid--CoA ligase [Rhodococcus ruber]WKK14861.1 long-chain fatty acid--CoA ligase [Rhodococcus ruber]
MSIVDTDTVHSGPSLQEAPVLAGGPLPLEGKRTACEAFQANVSLLGDGPALRLAHDDLVISWRSYGEQVRNVASGLDSLGVRRDDVVTLMLTNRPEFFIADTAAQHLGAVPFSVYNSAPANQIAHQLVHTKTRVVVTERLYLATVEAAIFQGGAPIEHVIVVDGAAQDGHLTLDQVAGMKREGFDFEATWQAVSPDDVATLIFTSGTTGPPKAVELTHANLLYQWQLLVRTWPIRPFGRIVSYLPSAHIADRTIGIYCMNFMGFTVTCCPDPQQLAAVLPDARPTLFLAVPRIWEKFRKAIEAKVNADPDEARRAAFWSGLEAGMRCVRAEQQGELPDPADVDARNEAERHIFAPLRAALGLGDVETFMVGAAPMQFEVHEYFAALGMALPEVWGMSESSAIVTWNPSGGIKFGTVGPPMPGIEVKLDDDGEILVRGPLVMRGYRDDPVRTAEAIDSDGWLHTGDVGAWEPDGYLRLIDRKKELIINSAGKNMSPMNIESEIKTASPLIAQVCVVGDQRKYNVALVVLDPLVAAQFAQERGHDVGDSPSALATLDVIRSEIDAAFEKANSRLARVEQIKRWSILGEDWQPGSTELTPTMKLRRKAVEEKYAERIAALYDQDALR